MLLYLVQHGEAGKEEEDPKRGLSDKGIHDVEKIAAYLQKLPVRVNEIYHSAKPRAQQTAAILAQHLKPDKGINQGDNLLPMDDPGLWAMRIKGMEEDMMVVGHLPYMAKLAGLLLCGDQEKIVIDFKMGGIVCLKRFEDGNWLLEWMLLPGLIK